MNTNELAGHVKILGWLNIVLSVLTILVMGFVGIILLGAGAISGEAEAFGVMFVIALFVGFFMLALAIPGILAGWGLLNGKNWARVLAIVLGCLNILSFPFGTAVGIYTLWVLLLHEDSHDYFANQGKLASVS
ncbi:MAG: hypothetical protein AAF490_10960 [Chloroflexota bacterium]